MIPILLLVSLLLCHYLGDYCLTFPAMIRAKADGRKPWPIAVHAGIHALLVGACLATFGIGGMTVLVMMALELITHFIIDTGKAWLTASSALLRDNKRKPYWMLYGFDQLLHQMVVVAIWAYVLHP